MTEQKLTPDERPIDRHDLYAKRRDRMERIADALYDQLCPDELFLQLCAEGSDWLKVMNDHYAWIEDTGRVALHFDQYALVASVKTFKWALQHLGLLDVAEWWLAHPGRNSHPNWRAWWPCDAMVMELHIPDE